MVDILEYVTLGDITTSTQIYYDPDPRSTVVDEDVELLEGHFDIQEEEEDDKDTDRYCCRRTTVAAIFAPLLYTPVHIRSCV